MYKIRYLIFIILIFLSGELVYSNYYTPGTGKNWNLDSLVYYSAGDVTYANGFYFINDTINVSQSDTIKILSNSIIKISADVLINIQGILIINPPDSVKMTAIDTTLKFIGIRLDSLSDASVFKKLIFEYGNSIRLLDCDMLIDSCTIRFNTMVSTASSSAINLFRSNPVISNNKIFRNRRAAISSGANIASSPVIINNLIYENGTENGNYPQINFGATGTNPMIIRNNVIRGYFTNAGGISILPAGSVPKVIIENNIIKNNRYGIALQGGNINAYINNNIIDSNNIQGLPLLGGSGINFNGTSTQTSIVTRNTIRWNLWGITIQGTAKPNLGDLFSPDTIDVGLNRIYNNSHNDSIIDLYNNTPDSIKAENNFWGTLNLDTVEAHIVHKPDISALGFVDYLPIWNLSNIHPVSQSESNDYFLYNAYPNPFNITARIKFTIPYKSFIKLEIYSILGKKVDELINSELNQGLYEINWNADRFSSGVYFYRLSGNNFTETKRIVLIK